MDSSIPTSLRLQKKMLADKFPGSSNDQTNCLVFFPAEDKYSVVLMKSIVEDCTDVKSKVTIKDSKGKCWPCVVVFKRSMEACRERQRKLELILDGDIEDQVVQVTKRKSNEEKAVGSNKKRPRVEVCSEEEEDSDVEEVNKEAARVKALILKSSPMDTVEPAKSLEDVLKGLFQGVYTRLDDMCSVLKQQKQAPVAPLHTSTPKPKMSTKAGPSGVTQEQDLDSSSSTTQTQGSPTTTKSELLSYEQEEFIWNGTNLLADVCAKAKKPKLYATSLLSVLFTDDEMRNGCVEPEEGSTRKPALEQIRVNLLKKCIRVKYGEKTIEKGWSEIRISLNQKCLDKVKAFRRMNAPAPAPIDIEPIDIEQENVDDE